jgi:diguanylate cyclase (GGDEF)-like protein/PAS domain S-box-containing protein
MTPMPVRASFADLLGLINGSCPQVGLELRLTSQGSGSIFGPEPRSRTAEEPIVSVPLRTAGWELLGAITVRGVEPPAVAELERVETGAAIALLLIEATQASDYGALIARVPAILYIADPGIDGRFHYVSPQIRTILGYSEQEWMDNPRRWADSIHPEDRDEVLERELRHVAPPLPDPLAVEYRMLHREGHAVWIRDDALLLGDEGGRMRWYGVLSDVSDRKRADHELERRAAQQAAVARLGEHALERVAVDDLIDEAVTSAAALVEVEEALVGEVMPGGRELKLRAAYGPAKHHVGRMRALSERGSQASFTLQTGAPVVVEEWLTETRFAQSEPARLRGIRSGVCVQIEGTHGPFGVFSVDSNSPRAYTPGDIDFVQSLANVLADALERRRTEAAIEHRSLHDPLTGLPNRVLFLDRLQQSLERLRRHSPALIAVLFIDLDHFKFVNDSLGHHAGDELLTGVATRLRQVVRPADTVARFGGDEFGLLLEEIVNERDAIAMAERVAAVFTRPFVLETNEYFVTTSIGIALASGAERPQDLIRDADAAMYRAKERGRARYELFDENMRARAIARLRMENDLRQAVERDELELAYQPVLSLADNAIIGVEALVRWEHPQRGPVAPEEFIPVAEDNGLIDRIGRWVLERACRDAVAWGGMRPDAAPLYISVNLSPLQVAAGTFEATLLEILDATGLDPTLLGFELTESLLLSEDDAVGATLQALKRIGVGLALDDFGTGYSSLSYLTRLPLDAVKVDSSFVGALGTEGPDSAITEAIIGMARALSLRVVGEGVETEAQLLELRRLGCHYVQGNLLSPPVPAESIGAVLHAGVKLAPG